METTTQTTDALKRSTAADSARAWVAMGELAQFMEVPQSVPPRKFNNARQIRGNGACIQHLCEDQTNCGPSGFHIAVASLATMRHFIERRPMAQHRCNISAPFMLSCKRPDKSDHMTRLILLHAAWTNCVTSGGWDHWWNLEP